MLLPTMVCLEKSLTGNSILTAIQALWLPLTTLSMPPRSKPSMTCYHFCEAQAPHSLHSSQHTTTTITQQQQHLMRRLHRQRRRDHICTRQMSTDSIRTTTTRIAQGSYRDELELRIITAGKGRLQARTIPIHFLYMMLYRRTGTEGYGTRRKIYKFFNLHISHRECYYCLV
jgi:hypothetical protein